MALTPEELELERVALSSLPRWITNNETVRESFAAFAAQVGAARTQLAHWLGEMAHVSTSTGVESPDIVDYLDALAKDRGTSRADGESDEALRYRLRNTTDAINYPSLLPLVNGMLEADGVVGTAVMYDLRSNRAFFGDNEPQLGTGGTFALVSGTTYKFTPTAGWEGNKPPYVNPARVDTPAKSYQLTFSGADDAGNDGTFPVTGIATDGATFTNASGVAAVDAGVAWRVDRYNWRPAQLTPGTGAGKAYLNRGFRMGGTYPTIQLILPHGTSEETLQAILTAMGDKKGAGVRVVVERRKTGDVYLTGPATAETDAFSVSAEIIVTSYPGSLPDTMGALSGWTGTAMWDVAWNFGDCTAGSCASLTGSTSSVTLGDLSVDPTELSAPQAGWATQGGIRVTTATQLLFSANAALTVSTTIPSAYMLVFSCAAGPSGVQVIMSGYTGFGNEGWAIEALGASGLRVRSMGSASSYVTSSTAAFDGLPHAIMVVVDDAAGKVKLFTEWGTAELTGLTYTQSGANLLTIGPESTGASWFEPVDYYQAAFGKHPLAYTNAATALSTYHTALTTGVAPAAIVGLPTTLAELNAALGVVTLTNAYNLDSATPAPMTGSAGPSLTAFTGTMAGGVTGTAPTVTAAPQVRASFTSQAIIDINSNGDNLQGTAAMPDLAHTGVVLVRMPNGTHPGTSNAILGIQSGTTGQTPWRIGGSASTGNIQLESYNTYSGTLRAASITATNIANDGAWRLILWRRDNSGGTNRITVTTPAGKSSSSSAAIGISPAAMSEEGGLGRIHQSPFAINPLFVGMALFGWGTSLATNADIETAADNFRWRYGI